jgi:hypothetical protein
LSLTPRRRSLATVQAAYYAATAAAPFISREWFERVTGPKTEWWLVLTVAGLVGAAGGALGVAARREPGPDTVVLGAGCACALGVIDVVYVCRRRIAPVYLLDAAVQLPIALAWILAVRDERLL